MTTEGAPPFGDVLSRLRVAAGLTQEELAERASLSVRGISDLERGVRTRPHPMTVRQLAEALQLSPQDRATFEEAAHAPDGAGRRNEPVPEGSFLGALPSTPLVGREEDVERFHSTLDAVIEGSGHLLLLSGELGVGKTRLLQELMVAARSRDFLVLTGRCDAAEQHMVYAPLLDALGGSIATMPSSVRSEGQRLWKRVQQLARGASDLADKVEQQHLFAAVGDLLALVSRSAPLALLLDDLQWVDDGSLKLLQHLARITRSSSVLLAGAYRDVRVTEEHPSLAHMVQNLSRDRLAERVTVRRLSLEETTQLVAAIMGQEEVSEEFASFVYRRTKGNPRLIDQLVRSLGGRLELQGEIGAGSMGRVFRAFDRATQRTVAAKLVLARHEIDLDALLRFQQEGAVLTRLEHPNIVHIYETFVEEHASCIIMELLEGESLGQILQDGPLLLQRAKELALQVAEALGYAHNQEIVHRDIKPDNVMVLPDDQVKVTDFGIARILQPDTSLQTMATTGMRMGTPLYMAPEQIEGKKIDGRTDIYALGAMLYHMVTGGPPFEGSDALTVAVKHLQEEPPPPSRVNAGVPPEWDEVILKALAKDPKGRFQSASEMAKAIQALPVEPVRRDQTQAARRPVRLVIAGAFLAVAVAGSLLVRMVVFPSHSAQGQAQSALAPKLDAYLSSLTNQHQMSGTVLVAHGGRIILSKGYGLADRQHHVPNGPTVRYPSIANFNINLTAGAILEEEGTLHPADRICRYLSSCPSSWKRITIRQVIEGTSGLAAINWPLLPGTTAQSLAACQTAGLIAVPARTIDYENCDTIVLGTIMEKVTHQSWESVIRRTVLNRADMHDTGRLTDALQPPARANDYNGNSAVSGARYYYNPYFELYSTTPDVLRYDESFFGNKLLSPAAVRVALIPRDVSSDPGIPDARNALLDWKVGHLAGQPVIYRYGTTDSNFTGINMRFPSDSTTVIVNSNDRTDDAEPIGVDLARLIYGRAPLLTTQHRPIPSVAPGKAIQATIDVRAPVALAAFAHHMVWLPNFNLGTLTRVSSRTSQVAGVSQVTQQLSSQTNGDPLSVASDGKQLWIILATARQVARVDPASGKILQRVPTGDPWMSDLTVSNGIVWSPSYKGDDVLRIDPRTHTVTHIGRHLGFPTEITAGNGSVWVSSFHSGLVRRIDERTGRIVAAYHVGSDPESLALGYGSLWVVNGTGGYVSRLDPRTGRLIAQIELGHGEQNPNGGPCCHGIAIGEGAVWVAVHRDHKIVRIDPTTDRATSQLVLPIPPAETSIDVFDVMVGDGSVWVHADPRYVFRIDPKAMA